MKVVIPVAGVGLRLRPLTYTQPKPLIPIAGKPILAHIIDQFLDIGINDFVFIIGYLGDKIKHYVESHYPGIQKTFVHQMERKGLGHAIYSAKNELEGCNDMSILLGDTILELDLKAFTKVPYSCIGVKKVENPREFGVVEQDEHGFVLKMIEKPSIPITNLAIVGLYKIKEVDLLIEALEYNIQNDIRTNQEFQLTDALQRLIMQGIQMKTMEVDNWFDCGRRDIVLETNASMLEQSEEAQKDYGNYINSIIIPPVYIGEHCTIENSIIGPHVSIGENTTIQRAAIQNSIIGNYAAIQEIVLQSSIIGSDTAIKGSIHSLNIGDNTEMDLG